jgi:adenylate kinase family enzyme
MLEENFKHKVFVTGVFGSGKTYFCQNFVEERGSHQYIAFDMHYDYSGKTLDSVYDEMERHDKFIIDALPRNDTREGGERFIDYYLKNQCTIILIKCNLDTWLDRLRSKVWYRQQDQDHYEKCYEEFYNEWVDDVLINSPIEGKIAIHDSSTNQPEV